MRRSRIRLRGMASASALLVALGQLVVIGATPLVVHATPVELAVQLTDLAVVPAGGAAGGNARLALTVETDTGDPDTGQLCATVVDALVPGVGDDSFSTSIGAAAFGATGSLVATLPTGRSGLP